MQKVLAIIAATFIASGGNAQPRGAWMRKCQAQDPELANSNGFRVCTELYVAELEKQQSRLVSEVSRRLSVGTDADSTPPPATDRFMKSQGLWRNYVEEHCSVVQALAGGEGPVGDAVPSCSADAFESRNKQLMQLLKAARTH